jgi:hypothetical protein
MNTLAPDLSPAGELQTLLASRVALVVIESREEARVMEVVREAALKAQRGRNWGVFAWSVTDGLLRVDVDLGGAQRNLAQPEQLLKHIKATPMAGIYVLLDFHPYLDNPMFVRAIKDIAQDYQKCAHDRAHQLRGQVAAGARTFARLRPMPNKDERQAIVMDGARVAKGSGGAAPTRKGRKDGRQSRRTAAHDDGTLTRQAIFNDGALTDDDLGPLLAAKYQLLNRGGTLSFEPDTARFAEVGGLKNLRRWILQRKAAFDGTAPDLDAPKGVLLLGVQGCGKSLAARAAAGVLGVPLVRLDFGALYSKWHGESEKNCASRCRPPRPSRPACCGWTKSKRRCPGRDGDSGTSRRVLGAFLTWLSEQRARVFIVATANDITALPPELVRKGRFDEIFFVDLPTPLARLEILGIHCKKRAVKISEQDMKALAARSEGFSGAELEQAVVSALYTAHANKQPVSAATIAAELEATKPLSVVMGEKIAELREWAKERTVPAD